MRVTVNIYRQGFAKAAVHEAHVTSLESRWAVVGTDGAKKSWWIVHRPSGKGVWSIYPSHVSSLRGCLAIVKAWEAQTHLNWAALDTVTFGGALVPTPELLALVTEAREIASVA